MLKEYLEGIKDLTPEKNGIIQLALSFLIF